MDITSQHVVVVARLFAAATVVCFAIDASAIPGDSFVTRNYLEVRSRKPNPIFKESKCSSDQFKCVSGQCIPQKWVCDLFDDCGDYSDEYNCHHSGGCPKDRFDCGNNQCYDKNFLCDKQPDCSNGADEAEGVCPLSSICQFGRFKCSSNSQCIDQSLVCNNVSDCPDHSDEAGCVHCSPVTEFACKSPQTNRTTQCISQSYICDGIPDCSEGQDEKLAICNVRKPPPTLPSASPLLRPSVTTATTTKTTTTGTAKTSVASYKSSHSRPESEMKKSQSDQSSRCLYDQFHCTNGQCISRQLVCDRQFDCLDASDEENCPIDPFTSPPYYSRPYSHHHQRPSTTRYMGIKPGIDLKVYDTPQTQFSGDDVVFRCRDEGLARTNVQWTREDGQPFPPGTSDINGRLTMYSVSTKDSGVYLCKTTGPYPEKIGQAQLNVIPRTRTSISTYFNRPTQGQLSPPAELRSPVTSETCSPGQFQCFSGGCVDRTVFCNTYKDCKDGSDENVCVKKCKFDEFRCANLFQCVSKKDRCDGLAQCSDGSDEVSCSKTRNMNNNFLGKVDCSFSQFKCGDGSCISHSYQCDGYSDCEDASDENNCFAPRITSALPKRIRGKDGSTLTINCTAFGNPAPSIRWRFNHQLVSETARSSICSEKCIDCSTQGSITMSTLKIYRLTTGDSGLYTCEAENALKIVISTDTLVTVGGVN